MRLEKNTANAAAYPREDPICGLSRGTRGESMRRGTRHCVDPPDATTHSHAQGGGRPFAPTTDCAREDPAPFEGCRYPSSRTEAPGTRSWGRTVAGGVAFWNVLPHVRGLSLIAATSLLTAFGPPGEEAEAEIPPRASLTVDASAVEDSGADLETWVEEEGRGVLKNKDVGPAESADDPTVIIKIVPLLGDVPGYACDIDGEIQGKPIEGATIHITCDACTRTMLVEKIVIELGGFLPRLTPQTAEPDPVPDTPAPGPKPEPKMPPMGGAGIGGLVVGGVGVVGIGLGIGFLATPNGRAEGKPASLVSYTGPGVAALAAGVVLTGVGAAMWAADRKRRKNEFESQKASVSVAPAFSPTFGGAVLVGRF